MTVDGGAEGGAAPPAGGAAGVAPSVPDAPALRRLLTARAAGSLLATFAPLLGALRCRLLRSDGGLHGEALGPAWSGGVAGASPLPAEARSLTVSGAEVGRIVFDPTPAEPLERAAADALVAAVQRALDAAVAQRELASETLERYREIHLLYRIGEALSGTLDPAAVPRRVLREARGIIDGSGGGVWLVPAADADPGLTVVEDDALGVLTSIAPEGAVGGPAEVAAAAEAVAAAVALGAAVRARLADPAKPTILAGPAPTGATGAATASAEAIVPTAAPGTAAPAAHHLWAPLLARDVLLGGVWLTRAATEPVFTAGDAKLLSALATQAAAFLDNARLHQRALAQERMEHELQLAYEVQARLMPRRIPELAGWELAAFWRPAREVSGDFYDLMQVGNGVGMVVADVADKGMPAALFMAVTRSLLRAGATPGQAPAQVVGTVNRLAALDAADGMFVTLWYGDLRPDGGVRYVNAGHNPPLLIRADGGVERLPRTGILVGWDADATFGEAAVTLAADDLLVAFTDGVTEARDPVGEEFGEARLLDVVLAHRAASAAELIREVERALDAFVATAATHDDCTLVIAKRRGTTP